ncbi:MAG: hypothetical protein ABFS18_11655 [Thermodesulfobacteriota bacterium]
MLTKEQIEKAKNEAVTVDPHYGHDDSIRAAYEWLDAQKKIKHPSKIFHRLKHLIEEWAGIYVTPHDVKIAAYLHPAINGDYYPYYNISSRLTEPSTDRLKNIGEAFTHATRESHKSSNYYVQE